jgi:hypothetical protein
MARRKHPSHDRRAQAARKTRFDRLSDEDIDARWKSLLPTFKRTFIVAALIATALFCVNHFLLLPQRATDIVNVAFQVTCAMAVCFGVLLAMGLWVSRGGWRKPSDAG